MIVIGPTAELKRDELAIISSYDDWSFNWRNNLDCKEVVRLWQRR
jgi:hypothetical protein